VIRHLNHTPHTQRILAPGALEVSADALAALLAWVQPDDGLEAGGVLLGRYITGGGMVIDAISTPGPRDLRERCYFHRDALHHNLAVFTAWEASGGTCHYLGNWHTHPEPIPAPSPLDVSEWLRDAAEIRTQHESPNLPLVYLIVGQHRIGAWAIGDPALPKFEGFER